MPNPSPAGPRALGAMAYCQSLNTLLEGEAAHGLRPGAGLTGSGGRAAHADCHTAQLSRVAAARHWRDSSAPRPTTASAAAEVSAIHCYFDRTVQEGGYGHA